VHATHSVCLLFIFCVQDVVTANPDEFKRPPFQLTREGDLIYGRGVTDCLVSERKATGTKI
jgi:hypothetical protein